MKKILVKRRASLGDVLNTTPVVRRLREENPDASICVNTLHGHAYLNNLHVNHVMGNPPVNWEEDFDQVIDLNNCFESNRRIHQVDANMLRAFGDTDGDKTIILKSQPLEEEGDPHWEKVVVVHANRTWSQRTLSQTFWNEIVVALENCGFTVILTGTSQDWPLSSGIDMKDKLSLAHQVWLIGRAACFLTCASGLVTVAGATETPIVSFTSMTPWQNFFPYRHEIIGWNMHSIRTPLDCYGCDVDEPPSEFYRCKFGTDACMQSFSVEQAVETVKYAIAEDKRHEL